VSYDLLMNIFTPGSPLHDGATIISDGRIKAASCYVPLTTDPDLSSAYGARHRAAVGITEESDAVAVVVSEERGEVSLAAGGRIVEDLGARELTARLEAALTPGGDGRPLGGEPAETAVVDSGHA
jgi:diadenylate cyclase